eukprot:CAMPEP_0115185882 /NCGR_PEP_ID=MMETSP0270-20121206/9699_1 /TAXON_ID=71861 /ORGANISM="Scrippsiella trochoidea, Strain CCMP3099" /LENGTH=619 /DNA_ID=CAMNT_0002598997 /DNA_START=110 /DNA_END=1969 /DNA_ORIENTATION=+
MAQVSFAVSDVPQMLPGDVPLKGNKSKLEAGEGSPIHATATQSTTCPEDDLSPGCITHLDTSSSDWMGTDSPTGSPWHSSSPGGLTAGSSPDSDKSSGGTAGGGGGFGMAAQRAAKSRLKATLPPAIAEEAESAEASAENTPQPLDDEERKEAPVAASGINIKTPGSQLHGTGECRPCAWLYKPGGCQNGAECRHCHLCPEGEIKARKKNKVDTIKGSKEKLESSPPKEKQPTRGQSSPGKEDSLDLGPPPGLTTPPAGPAAAPVVVVDRPPAESAGSMLHSSGQCRPCAWYYKLQGCQNGAECRHCHMCPEGEIKARRKAKTASGGGATSGGDTSEAEPKAAGEATTEQLRLPFASKRPSGAAAADEAPASATSGGAEPAPSVGSAAHGSGQCRPCAWFYKPKGCENGAECRHCHLCPEGEIRERRKVKVTMLKKHIAQEQEMDIERAICAVQKYQEAMLAASWQAQAMWEAAAVTAAVVAEADPLSSPMAAAALAAASAAASPMAASPLSIHLPADPFAGASPVAGLEGLPSTGSALHVLGKCRPCAWFWKSQGCQNGAACAHCHLCPQGELKERKRIKESAMRMGAIMPVRPGSSPVAGSSSRSPRVVKIAPILGA